MLTSLVIKDIVLIDRLEFALGKGLNIFTGETGAGKSIVMDALALALGARSDAALLREGAGQAAVTACFDGPMPRTLVALLSEQGLNIDGELILRRTVARDGKSRAFVNDQPVGVALLRWIGELLLESHGQFETHGLLDPSTHRVLLDSYAGLEALAEQTAQSHALWRKAQEKHAEEEKSRAQSASEAEFLGAAVAEIDELDPKDGEIDELAEKRKTLQNCEKIADTLAVCDAALSGDGGAAGKLAQAGKALARITDKTSGIADMLGTVDRALAETQEAQAALDTLMRQVAAPGETLEALEDRLFRLRALARKHNVQPEELPTLGARLRERLALLDDASGRLAALSEAVKQARKAYEDNASALSIRRKAAAQNLSRAVGKELIPLKMERAVFTVVCEPLPEDAWGPDGMDRIVFTAATNPGTQAGPLHKIASGGELARFMLAVKVVLAGADPVPTLVFDEVDAGIGGRQASAVGERLAKLGQTTQVLVVTHSPQVAARGDVHLRVEKIVKKGQAFSRVVTLDKAARIEEIARMLAGDKTTAAARKAAQSLIEDKK